MTKLCGCDADVSGILWHDDTHNVSMPIVISFFTNLFYLRDAYELARSCRLFNLSYYIAGTSDLGGWRENTNYKPSWIRTVSDLFPDRALVWIDADGRFRSFPTLFHELNVLVGYHIWEGKYPASGTIYFGAWIKRNLLLEQWIKEVTDAPMATDQICLGSTLEHLGLQPYILPRPYCHIYDSNNGIDLTSSPVIEHMQTSRYTLRSVASVMINRD